MDEEPATTARPGLEAAPPRRRATATMAAAFVGTVFVALLVVLSLIPVPAFFHDIGSARGHSAAYAAAVVILFPVFRRRRSRMAVLAGLWLLGVALEAGQSLVGWRGASLADIGYNTAGLVAGAAVFMLVGGVVSYVRELGSTPSRTQS